MYGLLKAARTIDRARAGYSEARRWIVRWFTRLREEILQYSVEMLEVLVMKVRSYQLVREA